MSRQTRCRRPRVQRPIEQASSTAARPLTSVERSRLHRRYARMSGRGFVLGYDTLGIVVTAATPEEMIVATDAVIVEATRGQEPS